MENGEGTPRLMEQDAAIGLGCCLGFVGLVLGLALGYIVWGVWGH